MDFCESEKHGRGYSIADLIRLGLESNGIITAAVTDGHLLKGRQYRVKFVRPYTADRAIEEQHPSVFLAEQPAFDVFDLSCCTQQKAWDQEFLNCTDPNPPAAETHPAESQAAETLATRDRERLKNLRWMD